MAATSSSAVTRGIAWTKPPFRAAPGKRESFILDFANDPEQIVASFQPYYRTTLLSAETDPNKLHDLKAALEDAGVYREELVVTFVDQYLADVPRPQLDAMLDSCVAAYKELDEDGQILFKGSAKAFVRTYNFLSQILPWGNAGWERLAIFLTYLTPRLPSPKEEAAVGRDILDAIDMDSYRAEVKEAMTLALVDENIEVEPANVTGAGGKPDAEYDRLSSIVRSFNDIFADAGFTDADRVAKYVTGAMMDGLVGDEQLRRLAATTDSQNQRIEFDQALKALVNASWMDNWELFDRLDKDPQFKSAFGEHMYKLWAARVGQLGAG